MPLVASFHRLARVDESLLPHNLFDHDGKVDIRHVKGRRRASLSSLRRRRSARMFRLFS